MKNKIKKSKKLINQLVPFWKQLQALESNFRLNVVRLETKMAEDTGIKDIEFFYCDGYCGIGNMSKTMGLIHDRELE